MKIGKRQIQDNSPTFIIAEIGCNYEGDLKRAKEMIHKAAEAGADAVKFQTFVPDKLTTKTAPKFWKIKGCYGKTQYEEFKHMPQLSFKQYSELKKVADRLGIIFFSTPEDEDSADMLEQLDVPLFKISSMNITNLPLLSHIAKKGKPIILSTGASDIDEIKEAINIIEAEGNHRIILLHCISSYPTKVEDVNLYMMKHIKETFPNYPVGYSDHTKMDESLCVLMAVVALGARVIEKHFTFDKNRDGYDHQISANYNDLKKMIQNARLIEKALGSSIKKPTLSEKKARLLGRRSIVAKTNIPKGTVITKSMLAIKRPGIGIMPKFLDIVIGSRASRDIREDKVINWQMIKFVEKQNSLKRSK